MISQKTDKQIPDTYIMYDKVLQWLFRIEIIFNAKNKNSKNNIFALSFILENYLIYFWQLAFGFILENI